jgi:glycosyltransferase involved in cell wall biosynthesis
MRLLFVAPFAYGPNASHGGAVAAYSQFAALRARHEIAVVAFTAAGADAAAQAYLAEHASPFVGVPLDIGRGGGKLARLRGVRSGWPVDAELYRSAAMWRTLREVTAALRPDAVILQFPPLAQYVGAVAGCPVLMDVQDAFSVSAFRAATAQRGWRKLERLWDWWAWVRYERRFYARCQAVFTLTEQDLLGLRVFNPGLRGAAIGVPVPLPRLAPAPARPQPVIRFVGGFNHPANRGAVAFFLREVWPLVHARNPRARVEIAGRNAPAALLALADAHVQFLGFVPDLNEFLAGAAAVAVPLLAGGGIKIKTLEALAAGAVVVSTAIGVEGIGGSDGEHFVVRDDAAGFAAALVQILATPAAFETLRANGRALIAGYYAPALWSRRFDALIGAALPQPARAEAAQ